MNKNKFLVKAVSGTLCAAMIMSNITPTFAATTNEQTTSNVNETRQTEVLYNKSASYFVTIPKIIALDSNKESTYSVKIEGDIPSDKDVYVSPQDAISETDTIDFYMHDQSTKHPKTDVTAIVTQNKDTWDFEDVASGYEETNNKISASQLTAGNWKGTFNFNINMKGAHKHTYTSEVTKEPTCTEPGVKTFTCENGDDSYTEVIQPLGHNFSSEYTVDKEPTHTEAGSKSQHCSRCDAKQNVTSIPATGHKYNDGVVTKNPTCTEKGVKTFTCVDGDHSYTEEIPAIGHNYGEATYTWSSDKTTCTAKRVCVNDANHVETETVNSTNAITKNATCDKAGTKTYTANFKNSAFAKQTSTSSIPATGHKYNSGVVTKKPTCTEKGVKTFTCVENDNSYTEEIPATGHKYGTPTYTWSADGKTCTAKRVCANNSSHIETENATITNKVKVNATCTTKGTTTYTATFKNSAFTTQTKDVQDINALGHNYASTYTIDKNATCTETGSKSQHCSRCGAKQNVTSIPATGHKYGAVTYTWSNDKSTCTAKRVCTNNASHIETETVNSTNAITKNATCTETGIKTYTATFKNGAFANQTTTSTIPALGHDFNTDYTIDKNPTHTEDGSKSQHCKRCGAKQNIITIMATGHIYNAGVVTKNPTCTEKGLKTYTCISGDSSYTEEIPATGHKYGAVTYTWSSDKSTCTAKRVCANDASHIETETVNSTNEITKEATCTTTGTKTYTVTFKNGAFAKQTTTSTIPAIGHNYGEVTYTWSGDKSTCTAKRVCSIDGYEETETVSTTNSVSKEPTCETKGNRQYTATFKNNAFATQTKTSYNVIPVSHNYVNNVCTKCGSVEVKLGRTYSFGGYEWDIAEIDDRTHTAVLQSRGVTSGSWPGYKMAQFGNGSTYSSNINNKDISEYDDKTKTLYATIKNAEASTGHGLYLVDKLKVSGNNPTSNPISYESAFKAAATNYTSFGATYEYAWTGSVYSSSSNGTSAYWISSGGSSSGSSKTIITTIKGKKYKRIYYTQDLEAVVAPAFKLDLKKVTLNGNTLNIR